MKKYLLLLPIVLLSIVACENGKNSQSSIDGNGEDEQLLKEQVLSFENIKKEIHYDSKEYAREYSANLAYPTTGPDVLVNNIRSWINQTIYDAWKDDNDVPLSIFKGDLKDCDTLISYYLNYEAKVDHWYEVRLNFSKIYENDQYVSVSADLYRGLADYIKNRNCATFRKSNGKKIPVNSYFEKFDKKTKEIIWQYKDDDFSWLCPENVHEIDFSGMDICLQGDSIRFYIPNIPGRSSGTIIVPTSSLEMYLSKEIKSLLQ